MFHYRIVLTLVQLFFAEVSLAHTGSSGATLFLNKTIKVTAP